MSAPSEGVAAGLVPPEPGDFDAGDAGFEVLLLAGVDTVALGLAAWDGFAEPVVVQGVAVGLADFLPPVALVLAFADAFELAVLMAVALAVPVAGGVAAAVSPGLVLPPTGLPLDPLSVGLLAGLLAALLTGVTLGVTDFGWRAWPLRTTAKSARTRSPPPCSGWPRCRPDRRWWPPSRIGYPPRSRSGHRCCCWNWRVRPPSRAADEGLAQRGERQRDADGEHDAGSRQGRA